MLADLVHSGLGKCEREQMGLVPLSSAEVLERTGLNSEGGYEIPYFDINGNRVPGFSRIKLFGCKIKDKELRYWQPSGSASRAYLPRGIPWEKIIRDPANPIFIVEGEKKSVRISMEKGLLGLALGGVWSFQSKRLSLALLRDLEAIDWHGRVVLICFDSDATENDNVAMAEQRFAEELIRRGAVVRIIRLTPSSDGKKRGADDFLEQEGRAAFDKLIEDAALYVGRFDAMNREFLVVQSLGAVLKVSTGRVYDYAKLKNVVAAKYALHVVTPTGPKDIDMVKPWLADPNRNEVADMVYEPAQPPSYFYGDDGERYYNRFHGLGVVAEAGDVSPWLDLFEHLFVNAPEADREEILNRMAFKLQFPGKLVNISTVVIGGSGVGKSLFFEIYGACFGANYAEISNDDLHSTFNFDWQADKLFVLANEISAPDRRPDADRCKNLITQQVNKINDKYGAKFTQKNYITYAITSNYDNPLMVRADERRFYIHKSDARQLTKQEVARLVAWRDKHNGAARLLDWMLKREISASFDPTAPARETEGKVNAVITNQSVVQNFAEALMDAPKLVLDSDVAVWPLRTLANKGDFGGHLISDQALSTALLQFGAWQTKKVKIRGKPKRLWIIKDVEYWKEQEPVALARECARYNPIGGTTQPAPKRLAEGGDKVAARRIGGGVK
jgi:hypothetical protein